MIGDKLEEFPRTRPYRPCRSQWEVWFVKSHVRSLSEDIKYGW